MKAMLIHADGSSIQHDLDPDKIIDQARDLIGGYVERLEFRKDGELYTLLVDEEGGMKNLPPNATARALVPQPIVGPVILFQGQLK